MKNPYRPHKRQIKDPALRRERKHDYDPGSQGAVSRAAEFLADSLDSFALIRCRVADNFQDSDLAYALYQGEIVEAHGTREDPAVLVTCISIDTTFYRKSDAGLKEKYGVTVCQADIDGVIMNAGEYNLYRYVGGQAVLEGWQANDGLAEALRHDDAGFQNFHPWRELSAYEARQFSRDVLHLLSIGEFEHQDKMV
jgi:hypothetical protein